MEDDSTRLRRSLSLPLLVLYGVGTTVGAGIYALVGEVTAMAGPAAPLSFLVASVMAGFTACSFAELSSRFPRSAGEAYYVWKGFHRRFLSVAVGLLVVCAGTVSSAAIVNGFVGYLNELVATPRWLAIVGVVVVLGGIAAWGITQSVLAASVVTVIEVGGLLLVLWAGGGSLGGLPDVLADMTPGLDAGAWSGMLSGAILAFFAFIGFEDLANVAEEAKTPSRTMPRAVILTLLITTAIYMAVSVVAMLVVPVDELAASEAPLVLIFERGSGMSGRLLGVIGIVAILNGALIQIIMGSRVLYGLADQGHLPAALAYVNPVTQTPLVTTAIVAGIVMTLALGFRLAELAEATSLVTLTIFTVVNLALVRVKRVAPRTPDGPTFPAWVPVAGAAVSAGFLIYGLLDYLA